jgi:hypothetical protein
MSILLIQGSRHFLMQPYPRAIAKERLAREAAAVARPVLQPTFGQHDNKYPPEIS